VSIITVVVDSVGQPLLSRRVADDETVLLALIEAVITLADGCDVTWAINLNHGGAHCSSPCGAAAALHSRSHGVSRLSGYRGDGKSGMPRIGPRCSAWVRSLR
jgi:hypothetical protein